MVGRVALAAVALSLAGCRPPSEPTQGAWETLVSEGGGFSVRMPVSNRPVVWTSQPVGSLTQFDHEARTSAGSYRVSWIRYAGEQSPELLLQVRDEVASKMGAALLEDRPMSVGGFPSRHFIVQRMFGDERVIGHVRVVLARDKLIMLLFAPASGDAEPSLREPFFDSLAIGALAGR